MTFGCDFWFELGIGIKDRNWGLGFGNMIGDWDGGEIWDWDWKTGLVIGDWDRDWGLGLGMGDWDLGLRRGVGIVDCDWGLFVTFGFDFWL